MAANTADLSGGPVLLSLSLATASFALSTTFVRFCVRAGVSSGFGADDYASGVATIVALIGTIFGIIESTASDPARALEFDVLGQPWYLMSVTLSKISICLLFMSLLGRARQWRILLGVLIVLMAAVNLAFSLTVNLQCRPLEKVWKPLVEGSCWDPSVQLNFGYFQGAFSVFSWVFLALFPVFIVRDLSRDGEKSWPFYVTAVLSFASGIFTIVRTAQTSQTSGTSVYTLHYFYISLMANLEQNLGLISANVLVLGPLFSPTSSRRSNKNRSRSRKKARRDPYSSASSAGSSRSRKSTNTNGTKRANGKPKPPTSRTGSSQSITRPITRASSRASSNRDGAEIDIEHVAAAVVVDRRLSGLIIQGPGVVGNQGDGSGGNKTRYGYGNDDDDDDDDEYDLGDPRHRRRPSSLGGDDDDNDDDDISDDEDGEDDDDDDDDDDGEDIDLEAWPRGIIKTVSVEVVEEINTEYVAANGNNPGGAGAGAGAGQGVGRNSIIIMPGSRQQRAGMDSVDRVSGASGVEQDWEAMLRAGPPR
ncbi:hypothetical protein MFIFM68171_03698 [Madurella fahalii]|uniref:Rhodopsin domain-containing protein n=1 Tax=Madurella fahalii TaxID=1157608 RepID=A0ABQ0G6U7_9PEZI